MPKSAPEKPASRKPARKTGPKVLGVTRDGVRILKPGRATHFTPKEAREAVAAVIGANKAKAIHPVQPAAKRATVAGAHREIAARYPKVLAKLAK
jgi:hypothetical protein